MKCMGTKREIGTQPKPETPNKKKKSLNKTEAYSFFT